MAGWDDSIFGNLPQIDWGAAPRPTLPPDPFNAPGYSLPQKLAGYFNQRFVQPLWSQATLPGDIATGKTTMADPEAQQRVMDLAALAAFPPGANAPEGALTEGAAKRIKAPAVLTRTEPTADDINAILRSAGETKGEPWPTAQSPLFDVSPEALARNNQTVAQTSYRDVLPYPDPGTKQLPAKGRAQQIVEAREPLAERIAGDLQPLTDPSNPFHRLTQFYSTSPVLEQLTRQGVLDPDEAMQFMRDWAGQGAATSPRTATPQNMRNSSYLLWRRASGDPVPSEAGGWMPAMNQPGFPMMGMHANLADQFARGAENINTNPKPVMFREGWIGNQADVTADTHNIRGTLYNYDQLFPGQLHPGWFEGGEKGPGYQQYKAAGGFQAGQPLDVGSIKDTLEGATRGGVYRQTEYGVMADPWYDAAQRLGISPAAGQAGGWFNYGPITGLRSPPKILPDLLNDQLEHTSRILGVEPQRVLDWWGRRKIPLAENTVPGTTLSSSAIG